MHSLSDLRPRLEDAGAAGQRRRHAGHPRDRRGDRLHERRVGRRPPTRRVRCGVVAMCPSSCGRVARSTRPTSRSRSRTARLGSQVRPRRRVPRRFHLRRRDTRPARRRDVEEVAGRNLDGASSCARPPRRRLHQRAPLTRILARAQECPQSSSLAHRFARLLADRRRGSREHQRAGQTLPREPRAECVALVQSGRRRAGIPPTAWRCLGLLARVVRWLEQAKLLTTRRETLRVRARARATSARSPLPGQRSVTAPACPRGRR